MHSLNSGSLQQETALRDVIRTATELSDSLKYTARLRTKLPHAQFTSSEDRNCTQSLCCEAICTIHSK